MGKQIVKDQIVSLKNNIVILEQYYEDLKKLIEKNILIDNEIYNYNVYNALYNEVIEIKNELDEIINFL